MKPRRAGRVMMSGISGTGENKPSKINSVHDPDRLISADVGRHNGFLTIAVKRVAMPKLNLPCLTAA